MHLPVQGQPLHTRSLAMGATADADGSWHVAGHVVDIRKTGFAAMTTSLQPAGLIHFMSIEFRADPETLRIDHLEVRQPVVAIEPSRHSAGECCRDPAYRLKAMEGECLDEEFAKKLSLTFGGPRGCSHLLTLFLFLASAVRRARELRQAKHAQRSSQHEAGERVFQRSLALEGLEASEGIVELSVEAGDYLLRAERDTTNVLERLAHENDLRLHARVNAQDQTLQSLRAVERERDATTMDAPWRDRPEWGRELVGAPLLSGFAARVFQAYGSDPERGVLRDALLQLAPGYFQVLAAFADRWAARPDGEEPGGESAGMRANCYMWRPDGALGPL